MKSKFCVVFCICIFFGSYLFSQTLIPNVIGSAGSFDQSNTISLEWTLGEVAVQSAVNESSILTEGFHQPILITKIDDDPNELYDITVMPNPVNSILYLNIIAKENSQIQWTLINMNAKILLSDELAGETINEEIDMTRFENGLYILNIRNKQKTFSKSYKISKIN